jgi:hypothetical protein
LFVFLLCYYSLLTVIPTALVGQEMPASGKLQVQVMLGAPRTVGEANQLRAVDEARSSCLTSSSFSWVGWRYTTYFTLAGMPWTIFAPRRWHRGVRWFSPVIMAMGGAYVDKLENQRRCAMLHPLPRWTIERATPVQQALDEADAARRNIAAQRQKEMDDVRQLDEIMKQKR